MKLLRFPLTWLALVVGVGSPVRAGMVSLTYSGVNGDNHAITAVGSGNFQFADGLTTLSLGSLTAFSFTQTTTLADSSLSGSSQYRYGLADLARTLTAAGLALAASDGSMAKLETLTSISEPELTEMRTACTQFKNEVYKEIISAFDKCLDEVERQSGADIQG